MHLGIEWIDGHTPTAGLQRANLVLPFLLLSKKRQLGFPSNLAFLLLPPPPLPTFPPGPPPPLPPPSFSKRGWRGKQSTQGTGCGRREDGTPQRRLADHTADSASLFLQLPLPGALWLGHSAEARGAAAQPLQVHSRRVAAHVDLRGTTLCLEELPPRCLQTGELHPLGF